MLLSPLSAAEKDAGDFADDTLRDITTVVSIGAVGAVLGLSTLSFVEEPKDHLKNVVIGGAIGVIIGVGLVAFMAANKSRNLYEEGALNSGGKEFMTFQRMAWHANENGQSWRWTKNARQIGYSFTF